MEPRAGAACREHSLGHRTTLLPLCQQGLAGHNKDQQSSAGRVSRLCALVLRTTSRRNSPARPSTISSTSDASLARTPAALSLSLGSRETWPKLRAMAQGRESPHRDYPHPCSRRLSAREIHHPSPPPTTAQSHRHRGRRSDRRSRAVGNDETNRPLRRPSRAERDRSIEVIEGRLATHSGSTAIRLQPYPRCVVETSGFPRRAVLHGIVGRSRSDLFSLRGAYATAIILGLASEVLPDQPGTLVIHRLLHGLTVVVARSSL